MTKVGLFLALCFCLSQLANASQGDKIATPFGCINESTHINQPHNIEEYLIELLDSLANINNSVVGINRTVTKFQAFLILMEQELFGNLTNISDRFLTFGGEVFNKTSPLIDDAVKNFPAFLTALSSVDKTSNDVHKINIKAIAAVSTMVAFIFFSVGFMCLSCAAVCSGIFVHEYNKYRNKSLNINYSPVYQD